MKVSAAPIRLSRLVHDYPAFRRADDADERALPLFLAACDASSLGNVPGAERLGHP